MMRQLGRVLLCILTLVSANLLAAEKIALVIGNGDYQHVAKLKNPPKDVRLITDSLQDIGFTVTLLVDANVSKMKSEVKKFTAALDKSGKNTIGLFYFAGHGVTYEERNYLIPVTAEIDAGPDLQESAVSAQWVLGWMETAANATSVMILDACRDNPYKNILLASTRSLTQGMAEFDAPTGSFVAFSTAEGQVAYDGRGDYSPFATALAEEIKRPNTSVGDMMTHVNSRVRELTTGLGNKPQVPWTENSLADILMFNPRADSKRQDGGSVEPVPSPQQVVQPRKKSREELEERMWGVVENSEDPAQFKAFLKDYPDGRFAKYARLKIDKYSNPPEKQVPAQPEPAGPSPYQPAVDKQTVVTRGGDPDIAAMCRQFAAGDSSLFADCMENMDDSDEPEPYFPGTLPGGRPTGYPAPMPNQQMSEAVIWYDDQYNEWQVTYSGINFSASAMLAGTGMMQLQGQTQGNQVSYGIFDALGQQIGYGQGTFVNSNHIAVTRYWSNGSFLGSTKFHINHFPQ